MTKERSIWAIHMFRAKKFSELCPRSVQASASRTMRSLSAALKRRRVAHHMLQRRHHFVVQTLGFRHRMRPCSPTWDGHRRTLQFSHGDRPNGWACKNT